MENKQNQNDEKKLIKRFSYGIFSYDIATFYKGERNAPVDAFANLIYYYYNNCYNLKLLEKMIISTCLQSPDERFIRRDFLIDVLPSRFGGNLKEFPLRIGCLCDSDGNAKEWFCPYLNRKQAENYLIEKKLKWLVRFTEENRGIFVFTYRDEEPVFHHTRMYLLNDSYRMLNEEPSSRKYPTIVDLITKKFLESNNFLRQQSC